jgi:hypothetical protein
VAEGRKEEEESVSLVEMMGEGEIATKTTTAPACSLPIELHRSSSALRMLSPLLQRLGERRPP